MPDFTIRALDRAKDRRGVEAVDTVFETSSIFDVVARDRAIELVETAVSPPRTKRYSIAEVFQPWARWDTGWVAEAGGTIVGFATCGWEAWHERVNLWFLYMSPAWRRRGVGRALLERVEAHAAQLGATHVWLETSSSNVPGVTAYQHLGYALCGADTFYYGSYMPGESAIYMAKRV